MLESEKDLLRAVHYDIKDDGIIVDTAFHDIKELEVDHDVVKETIESIMEHPTNWMFSHKDFEGETLREIAFQIINFIDTNLMNLDFDKLKYGVIKLVNQYGKAAYHKLNKENL